MTEQKSGAELHTDGLTREKIIKAIAEQIKLKQWCVEKVIELSHDFAKTYGPSGCESRIIDLMDKIYKFVTDEN